MHSFEEKFYLEEEDSVKTNCVWEISPNCYLVCCSAEQRMKMATVKEVAVFNGCFIINSVENTIENFIELPKGIIREYYLRSCHKMGDYVVFLLAKRKISNSKWC